MRRIDDLDEYHTEIERWVKRMTFNYYAISSFVVAMKTNKIVWAPFVFQDETPAHFCHDVLLECKRRLG